LIDFPNRPLRRKGGLTAPIVLIILALTGCEAVLKQLPPAHVPQPAPEKPRLRLNTVEFSDLPRWKADNPGEALPVFLKSCEKLEKLPPDQAIGPRKEYGTGRDWADLCQTARLVRPGNDPEARYFFESRFQPYAVSNYLERRGLITGYYEPVLNGSFTPGQRFSLPIYARPEDLVSANLGEFDDKWSGEQIAGRIVDGRFRPYWSRAEIEDGALKGQQLEILWVDNAIDAFSLHIQGHGRVVLPDGSHIRIGYAGRNGRRYTAIGRELVARGIMDLDDVTMPSIRSWLEANPVAGTQVMRTNKSFIFFRVMDSESPIGAQGVSLTPGRSLAIDRAHLPLGVPLWLVTTDPGPSPRKQPLTRLVVTQDTGSAIKGPVRGDLYWGHGPEAALKAGLMKEDGQFFILLPKNRAPAAGRSG